MRTTKQISLKLLRVLKTVVGMKMCTLNNVKLFIMNIVELIFVYFSSVIFLLDGLSNSKRSNKDIHS